MVKIRAQVSWGSLGPLRALNKGKNIILVVKTYVPNTFCPKIKWN